MVTSGGKENKCTGTGAGTMANFRQISYLRSYILPLSLGCPVSGEVKQNGDHFRGPQALRQLQGVVGASRAGRSEWGGLGQGL